MFISYPGSDVPLRPGKLICIGKNYAAHAREMKSEVPQEPMIFLKPATSLVRSGAKVVLPSMSKEVHHEIELVAVIGKRGKNIKEVSAMTHVAGYAVGIDMTARDLQAEARKVGGPWSVAKGFDTFAPLGEFVSSSSVDDVHSLSLELKVSGITKQKGSTADMIFKLPVLISFASHIFTLEPGDLIFTGTPEGVGPVRDGDVIEAQISGLPPLRVHVSAQE